MSRIIGIDLGTTNSCISYIEDDEAKILPNKEGFYTTPSVVSYAENGDVKVGNHAKNQKVKNPTNTLSSIKRFIGRRFNDKHVLEDMELLPYSIVKDEEGNVRIALGKESQGHPSLLTPEEISAKILNYLKESAERHFGEEITQAVITVPAYFDEPQKKATADAARIAGLEPLRIVNEPTAAALAYSHQKKLDDKKVVVYDLGGGTFDVSVIHVTMSNNESSVDILSTHGDSYLGGDDFDKRVFHYLVKDLKAKENIEIDISTDFLSVETIKQAAEEAKKILSGNKSYDIDFTLYANNQMNNYSSQLSQAKLESLVEDLVVRTIEITKQAVAEANLSISDIDEVILVGGQSRMPLISEKLEALFNKKPCKDINPDEVVALGAGTLCGILSGDIKDIMLCDILPHSLGTSGENGEFVVLLPKGTPVPIEREQVFSTVSNNQFLIEVDIYQGEDAIAANNEKIGVFELPVEKAPAGEAKILIKFAISANGVISVHAKSLKSDTEQAIQIESKYGLGEKAVKKLFKENVLSKKLQSERAKIRLIKEESKIIITEIRKLIEDKGFKKNAAKLSLLSDELEKTFISNEYKIIEDAFIELTELFVKSIIKE